MREKKICSFLKYFVQWVNNSSSFKQAGPGLKTIDDNNDNNNNNNIFITFAMTKSKFLVIFRTRTKDFLIYQFMQ